MNQTMITKRTPVPTRRRSTGGLTGYEYLAVNVPLFVVLDHAVKDAVKNIVVKHCNGEYIAHVVECVDTYAKAIHAYLPGTPGGIERPERLFAVVVDRWSASVVLGIPRYSSLYSRITFRHRSKSGELGAGITEAG
jgi:hypothetical protein